VLRFTAGCLTVLVTGSGCASAAPAAADPSLVLHVGEKATVDGGGLALSFVGVSEDSRCPKGEQCIAAGRARVSLEATPRNGAAVRFELDTARQSETEVAGYFITLQSIEPYPVAGRPIPASDYVAKLSVGPSSPAAAPDK
jgi:hypothetical protein